MPNMYAKVENGKIVEFRNREVDRVSPAHKTASDGGPIVRPVVDPGMPAHDGATQFVTSEFVVEKAQVVKVYTVHMVDPAEAKRGRIEEVNLWRRKAMLPEITEKEYDDYVASKPASRV